MASYIRFDWAMKRLLRDKANFGVIEGLLTTLLDEKIRIVDLLEEKEGLEEEYIKYTRMNLFAENSCGELWLFVIQNDECTYFQSLLLGVSDLAEKYIRLTKGYENINRVYGVNIVFYNGRHGAGKDTVYHGTTEFRGIHDNDILQLSPFQREKFKVDTVSQLYPEYYILRVNDFDKWSKVPLNQWIYFLNTGEIPDDADAPGLAEARELLNVDSLSKEEKRAYYRHLDNVVILRDNITTERAEGRAEGRVEGIYAVAQNMKTLGLPMDTIIQATGLSAEEIEKL